MTRERVRLVCVGAGFMGGLWLRAVQRSQCAEVVGVVDLDESAARRAVDSIGRHDLPVGTDLLAVAAATGADALLDVTTPAAHHPVTQAGLLAGMPVLGEKPVASTLAEALSLAATAEVSGRLFMVSQSRRWNPQVAALRAMTTDLGRLGAITTEFLRGPRDVGFRARMDQPLLVDMAIHAFDTARYVVDADPVAVYCRTSNPAWSWYDGDADAVAVFEMAGGLTYTYVGSWCATGAETSWNGRWSVSGEHGSATWDGDHEPVLSSGRPAASHPRSPYADIDGALEVFCDALSSGHRPMGEVHENLMSLAMVEAAVASARTGGRVLVDDILQVAHGHAIADEQIPEVAERLRAWADVRDILTPPGGG